MAVISFLCSETAWGKPISRDLTLTHKAQYTLGSLHLSMVHWDGGLGHRAESLETSGQWGAEAQVEERSRGW